MSERCAVLRCRRPGVVRCLVDADWPNAHVGTIVRYFLCRVHCRPRVQWYANMDTTGNLCDPVEPGSPYARYQKVSK